MSMTMSKMLTKVEFREYFFRAEKFCFKLIGFVINLSSSLKNRSKTFHFKMKFEEIESLRGRNYCATLGRGHWRSTFSVINS